MGGTDSQKTRLITFGRTQGLRPGNGGGKPPTFDFLGFHRWTRSRKGTLVVARKPVRARFSRALKHVLPKRPQGPADSGQAVV
jgi:hypothetical protein